MRAKDNSSTCHSNRVIPKTVYNHLENSRYFLKAADRLLLPNENAIQLLLLLTGWENIEMADQELSAWASQDKVDNLLYKDHRYKLKSTPIVTRVIIGFNGEQSQTIDYLKDKDFKKLRETCLYGTYDDSLDDIFKSGWHLNDLQIGLVNRIKWVEQWIMVFANANT